MKKVLILGGTRFIGRNLVERLLGEDGFEITMFNRGRTGAGLFPKVKRIIGDRSTEDIQRIASDHWDVVVDLSCYFPADLEQVLKNLEKKPEKYVFISSCSVYDANEHNVLRDEFATTVGCTPEQFADTAAASYGHRKAGSERILQRSGVDHVIFRPALVFGPHDPTDRMYYWLHQVKFKNTLLMPDQGQRTFSVTYVHDLVEAIVRSMQQLLPSSVYNAITLPRVSIAQIVQEASALLGRTLPTTNASPEFLRKHEVSPWEDMPLWLDGDHYTYSNERMKKELGLRSIDLKDSLLETLRYYDAQGWDEPEYGMSERRRIELLGLLTAP